MQMRSLARTSWGPKILAYAFPSEKSLSAIRPTAWAQNAPLLGRASLSTVFLRKAILHPSDMWKISPMVHRYENDVSIRSMSIGSIPLLLLRVINEHTGSNDDSSMNHTKPFSSPASRIQEARGSRPLRSVRYIRSSGEVNSRGPSHEVWRSPKWSILYHLWRQHSKRVLSPNADQEPKWGHVRKQRWGWNHENTRVLISSQQDETPWIKCHMNTDARNIHWHSATQHNQSKLGYASDSLNFTFVHNRSNCLGCETSPKASEISLVQLLGCDWPLQIQTLQQQLPICLLINHFFEAGQKRSVNTSHTVEAIP